MEFLANFCLSIKWTVWSLVGVPKTWALIVYLFLPNGVVEQERYAVYDYTQCMQTGRAASERLWNNHDKQGNTQFMCVDKALTTP